MNAFPDTEKVLLLAFLLVILPIAISFVFYRSYVKRRKTLTEEEKAYDDSSNSSNFHYLFEILI